MKWAKTPSSTVVCAGSGTVVQNGQWTLLAADTGAVTENYVCNHAGDTATAIT